MNARVFLVQLLSLFFGLVYPAYGSIAAIESSSSVDDTHWLIYWLIFSLITILENLAWPLLQWIPLYSEGKVIMLAWLVLPQTKGALWVYEALLSKGIVKAREVLYKSPAIRQALANIDKSAAPVQARTDAENATEITRRRSRLGDVVKDVSTAFDSDLTRIAAMTDAKSRVKAENVFDKELNRLSKVAAARAAGSSGQFFKKGA
jgi:hypothetical protein